MPFVCSEPQETSSRGGWHDGPESDLQAGLSNWSAASQIYLVEKDRVREMLQVTVGSAREQVMLALIL